MSIAAEEAETYSGPGRLPWNLENTSLVAPGGRAQGEPKPVPLLFPPKLRIGAVDDPLEHEADRIADHVLRAPDAAPTTATPVTAGGNFVQRKCSCGGTCASCQSEAADDEHGTVRMKPAAAARTAARSVAPPIVHHVLRSPGRPLDAATRPFMETRFGRDFSHVQVHTGSAAELSAMQVNAHAYTVGSHIVFGPGRFAPATQEGRRLIAHELTHVVQQSGGRRLMVSREEADPDEEKLRGALKHAAAVGASVMTSEEFKQLKCVVRLGGCAQHRDGGASASAEEIESYNKECKSESGYTGNTNIVPTTEQCADLTPGRLDVVSPGRLNEAKSLLTEYGTLVAQGALADDEMARIDAAVANAEKLLGNLRGPDAPDQAPPDAPPWVIKSKDAKPVPPKSQISQASAGAGVLFSTAIRTAVGRALITPQGLAAAAVVAGLFVIAYLINDFLLRKEGADALEKLIAALLALFRTLSDAEIERRLKEKAKGKPQDQPKPPGGPGPIVDPPPAPDQKPRDQCLELFNLKPMVNDRWHTQRGAINGNITVSQAAFRLDAGVQPPAGQDTTEASRKWVRQIGKPTDDAGHVIANRFGGRADFNSKDGNIFPQDLSQNRGTMRSLDAVTADKHAQGSDVCVHIGLAYGTATDLRPGSLTYVLMFRSSGSKNFTPAIPAKVPNP